MKRYTSFVIIGLLLAALALGIGTALAAPKANPVSQASVIHPDFALLDADGVNVLESSAPVSTMQTCGQCHDTAFIASHAFHSDLGLSDYAATNETLDTSNGLFGKWDPLTYRFLSPAGDERLDLSTAEWLMVYGYRVVGGGPAETSRDGKDLTNLSPNKANPESAILNEDGSVSSWNWDESGTMEMNCFLCHLETPNNEARIEAIQSGQFGSAVTATLLGLNITSETGEGWEYNPEAFNENGEIKNETLGIQDPAQRANRCR